MRRQNNYKRFDDGFLPPNQQKKIKDFLLFSKNTKNQTPPSQKTKLDTHTTIKEIDFASHKEETNKIYDTNGVNKYP